MINKLLARATALNPFRPRARRISLPRGPQFTRPELVRGAWPFVLALSFSMLPFGTAAAGAQDGSALRQFVLGLLFLAGVFTIARFPGRWLQIQQAVPLSLFALVLYVLISALWSPEPGISFRRGAQVAGVVVLALAVVIGGMGQHRLHRLLAWPAIFSVALAISVTAAFPDFAFTEIGLRGFTTHKNTFGQFCVLVFLVSLAWILVERRYVASWCLLLVLALIGLVLSKSITAVLGLVGLFAASSWIVFRRLIYSSWVPLLLLVSMAVLAGTFAAGVFFGFPTFQEFFGAVLEPTGRDMTLTGRTYLWELMFAEAMRNPWFGLGYGSFWLGLEGRSGQIAMLVGWGYPGSAHNGFLDIFNELGLVGLALVLTVLVQHARNIWLLSSIDRSTAFMHAAVLVFVVTINFAEAVLVRTTQAWWMIVVLSIIDVAWRTAPLKAKGSGNSFGSRAADPSAAW